jgi:hypothetical protein
MSTKTLARGTKVTYQITRKVSHAPGTETITRHGKVDGWRDGKVMVRHAAGYTEFVDPADLKVKGHAPDAFTEDELGFMQLADSKVLAAAARGELDMNALAREYLAARGQGLNGEWVGFERARQIHSIV